MLRTQPAHTPSGGALSSSVLVLNRLYMAVHIVNVRRAFCLLFREMAEVIHLEEGQFANYSFQTWQEMSELRAEFKQPHEDWIRTVGFEIQVPRVIRLLKIRSPAQATFASESAQRIWPGMNTPANIAAGIIPRIN